MTRTFEMKRVKLIRHLIFHGCELHREGAGHSVFHNVKSRKTAPVPRHNEIAWPLVLKICKELEIDAPTER